MKTICGVLFRVEAISTIATAGVVAIVWFTDLPLGVPGEWEWSRVAADSFGLTILSLVIVAAPYLGFVWLGAKRIADSRAAETAAWLTGLVVAAFVWLWTAQEAAPEAFQLSKAVWVLYFPGPSGYFTEAREDPRPLREFLSDYERRMSEGDVLHIGTHPPGLIVAFRGLLAFCREAPWFAAAINATAPNSVRVSLDAVAATLGPDGQALTSADRAVLWLAALLAQGVAAATVAPLYGLMRRGCSRRASWMAASLWPAVPAVAVFLPKSDAFFPFLTALVLWLWLTGADRGSWFRGVLAGLALWLGLFLSLAFLSVAFLAAAATLWPRWADRSRLAGPQPFMRPIVGVAAGLGLPCLALRLFADVNLLSVWWLNLRNHAGFYRQYSRTYWKWLLANPVEFVVASGAPLVCLAIYGGYRQWKRGDLPACAPIVAFLTTWGLLWLSGKNMGEAARLWILLTPCLAWIAAPAFEEQAPDSIPPLVPESHMRFWAAMMGLQLISCAAIVMRVVGFQYA